MVGETVGPYRIVRFLGEGGMGNVWLAEHELIERPVAIKLLASHLADSESARRHFLTEVREAFVLRHDGIARVHDAGDAGGRLYMAQEFIDGESLKVRLAARGRLPQAEAVRIGLAIARALGYAHERGVVHRDVTPGNIMLARDGGVVLIDFGLALSDRSAGRSRTGEVLGTLDYLSPEVARGERADRRSDIYGLGAVLYHALTGGPPFAGEREHAVVGSPGTELEFAL